MGVLQLPSSAARKARSVTTATRVSSWFNWARNLREGSSSVLEGVTRRDEECEANSEKESVRTSEGGSLNPSADSGESHLQTKGKRSMSHSLRPPSNLYMTHKVLRSSTASILAH
jgi:hypothetical protein